MSHAKQRGFLLLEQLIIMGEILKIAIQKK
jgi:hypothetical protein